MCDQLNQVWFLSWAQAHFRVLSFCTKVVVSVAQCDLLPSLQQAIIYHTAGITYLLAFELNVPFVTFRWRLIDQNLVVRKNKGSCPVATSSSDHSLSEKDA